MKIKYSEFVKWKLTEMHVNENTDYSCYRDMTSVVRVHS